SPADRPGSSRRTRWAASYTTLGDTIKRLFTKLANDNFLQDLSPTEFARKSAEFLATLNVIHAFREGNGRTQLSFFLLLADQAGHTIDLDALDPDAFLHAMIASFDGDEAPLAAAIQGLIEDEDPRELS
uniref:Fic family protein n=1 Tax=Bradyrhizobium sp. SZCCHNRI3052 TaxID=3057295 RepID=UPI002915D3E6